MSVCIAESAFGDDMNYVPPRVPSLAYRILRGVVCLAAFASLGVMLAVGLAL